MISESAFKELARKLQTTELNVRREYVQQVFLANFYRQSESETIYFKGGTALRIIFSSPRFSEDLDFSADLYNSKKIENFIEDTLKEIEREGISVNIIETKETSGGYLAEVAFHLTTEEISVLLQFSKRSVHDRGEIVTIASDFLPPYTLVMLDRKRLVAEKIQAVLTRAKPRDFYDIYFMIRSKLLSSADKQLLVKAKNKLNSTAINFEQELKEFLPKSHWATIRDFQASLNREIEGFI